MVTISRAEYEEFQGQKERITALERQVELLTREILHEPGKTAQSKSYMWLYRTGGDTDRPLVLYEYQPGRGACHPQTLIACKLKFLIKIPAKN